MLSDEEKEAVEYWKTHMEILHWNTQLASEHYIKVLLDLVEKQSKGIEELKEKRLTLFDTTVKNSIKINDKKWEDKIKAKIEELEKQDKESKLSHNYLVIPVLQSLLEKE